MASVALDDMQTHGTNPAQLHMGCAIAFCGGQPFTTLIRSTSAILDKIFPALDQKKKEDIDKASAHDLSEMDPVIPPVSWL